MLANIHCAAVQGIAAHAVEVEVNDGYGETLVVIVGLPDAAVRESRDRVRAAIQNAQFEFPPRKITVNLAPADLPKESGRFDLPIALGIAATRIRLPDGAQANTLYLGELGLDGRLGRIRGALSLVAAAPPAGIRRAIVPLSNLDEASFCPDLEVMGAADLAELL